MMDTSIFAAFTALPDPRVQRTQRHVFSDILAIAILAVIAGADGWEDIETFGVAKQDWLASFLALPNGVPSHDTFARVIARLDPAAVEACFGQWVAQIADLTTGEVVALDGKALRGSTDTTLARSPLRVVSAWATGQGLMLGQVTTDGASGELTALRGLLELLDLRGCLVTIDALGCQDDIAATLVAQEATYLLTVKGNQPHLAEVVAAQEPTLTTAAAPDVEVWQHSERSHGRWEQRTVWTTQAVDPLRAVDGWDHIQTLVIVEAERQTEQGSSRQRRAFVSNGVLSAEQAGRAVRAHWLIENQLHWVLDITFREDQSRITDTYGAANLALLRRLALILLKREPTLKGSVAKKRFRAGLDTEYLKHVISQGI